MASLSTTTSLEKKDYVGARVTAAPALSNLPNVDEKDEDEGARLAGYVRNDYTEEEAAAVGRKLDRRVMPLLALVYLCVLLCSRSSFDDSRSSFNDSRPPSSSLTYFPSTVRNSSIRTASLIPP